MVKPTFTITSLTWPLAKWVLSLTTTAHTWPPVQWVHSYTYSYNHLSNVTTAQWVHSPIYSYNYLSNATTCSISTYSQPCFYNHLSHISTAQWVHILVLPSDFSLYYYFSSILVCIIETKHYITSSSPLRQYRYIQDVIFVLFSGKWCSCFR